MTEREKWLRVAEAFAGPAAYIGLCGAYRRLSGGDDNTEDDIIRRMCAIGEQTNGVRPLFPFRWDSGGLLDPPYEDYGPSRRLLACLFAAMTPRERRELGLPG
jgi:hypothetical protein